MDSDSDHFESADEEFLSDDQEEECKHKTKNIYVSHKVETVTEPDLKIQEISLKHDETVQAEVEHSNKLSDTEEEDKTTKQLINEPKEPAISQDITCDQTSLETDTVHETNKNNDESNANVISNETSNLPKQKPRVIERKERQQRSKEPKSKLGVKLGTKVSGDKNEQFWNAYTEAKKNEYAEPPTRVECWEEDLDWTPVEAETKPNTSPKLYSEKCDFSPDKNFWESEADYMELPREEKKENVQAAMDKLAETTNEQASGGWGSWGTWGVSSLLSTASLGVSTITNSVSQGLTTVLESGIGAPDPEELAKLHKEQRQKFAEKSEEPPQETEERSTNNTQIGFGLGNFVSGVSHITKLVETTGTKVLAGGLDTLEVIGKKTMEVLQEGDPGLKKKKAFFKIDQDKPVLSQILREAKEKAEQENKFLEEKHIAKKAHYETIFDDYQGLVHLEALEMLSKQCDIKLETLLETYTGSALTDMQETMAQIKELCELPDDDDDNATSDIETVREKVESAIAEMNIKITYEHFLKTWTDINTWLQENDTATEDEIHEKGIESLAHLTAIAVEQFHKGGELLLVKERRSTVDEADSLVQLTITLTGVIGVVAGKFSEKLNGSATSENVNSLITNIFLEAANSSSYVQDAFNLMIPVLQVGAV